MIKKKKTKDDSHNHERWMVSYADFVTLLFAFFVVLYATSEQNTEKGKQFEESVKKYLVKVGAFGSSKETANQELEQNSPIEAPLKKHNREAPESAQHIKIESYIEEKFSSRDIEQIIQDISEEEHGTKISIRSSELFNAGSTDVAVESETLRKLGKLLQTINYRVHIEAHAYNVKDEWGLAAYRAVALAKYFEKNYNIKRDRLAVTSYGASRPILPLQKENIDTNNRIDFLILTDDSNYR